MPLGRRQAGRQPRIRPQFGISTRMGRIRVTPSCELPAYLRRAGLEHFDAPLGCLASNASLARLPESPRDQSGPISRRSSMSALAICFFTPLTLIPTSPAISA